MTDIRERVILNALTYPAMLAGLVLSLLQGGTAFLTSAGGVLLGIGAFYPLFRAGGMGMGDLKLLAAIGALKGFPFLASAMVDTALAGGVLAIAVTSYRGTLRDTLRRSISILLRPVAPRTAGRRRPFSISGAARGDAIPYGVAIAAGTFASWWWRWPW